MAEEIFKPVVEKFSPQMLLISAGFDAHWSDPLTSLGLSTRGFFNISRKLVDLAEEYCQGKIVFVLEGGYDPRNVAGGSAAVLAALAKSAPGEEINDPSPHPEPDHDSLIAEIRKLHGIKS